MNARPRNPEPQAGQPRTRTITPRWIDNATPWTIRGMIAITLTISAVQNGR